jgi:hypothetical protein
MGMPPRPRWRGARTSSPVRRSNATFPISNRSDDDFRSDTLRTVAISTSLLDSDPVNGLQLRFDACSVPRQRRVDNSTHVRGESSLSSPHALSSATLPEWGVGHEARRPGSLAPDDVASRLGGQSLPGPEVAHPIQLHRARFVPGLKGSSNAAPSDHRSTQGIEGFPQRECLVGLTYQEGY